jgi:predicted nucleic acid-binding protein
MTSPDTMKMVCVIDSDIAIDYLRSKEYAVRFLQVSAEQGAIVISTLTHFEVYRGMRPGEESRTNVFLDSLLSVDVDADLAREAGKLMNGIRRKGITIDAADAIIAATAIRLDVPLISNNISHYPFPDIKLIRGKDSEGGFSVKERSRKYSIK